MEEKTHGRRYKGVEERYQLNEREKGMRLMRP